MHMWNGRQLYTIGMPTEVELMLRAIAIDSHRQQQTTTPPNSTIIK